VIQEFSPFYLWFEQRIFFKKNFKILNVKILTFVYLALFLCQDERKNNCCCLNYNVDFTYFLYEIIQKTKNDFKR